MAPSESGAACWPTGSDCALHRIKRLMRLQAFRARPRRRQLPKADGDRQVANVSLSILDR